MGNNSTRSATANARNRVPSAAYVRLKSHSDKLDEFIESQGFKELFKSFATYRKKPVANLYLYSLNKAYNEFLQEESRGHSCSDLRFTEKVKAAALLFPEDRKIIKNY